MPFIRREVRSLGGTWNDTILWYAKAVRRMRARPITDPESWWFLGAMHGFHPVVWERFSLIAAATPLPSDAVQAEFWAQCQHQSWFFLPWHRGYVWAFEDIVRAAVIAEGGPADWALPYWNYSDAADPAARTLPAAFAAATLPDGSDNPLRVDRRYGGGTVPIEIDAASVLLSALDDSVYTGGTSDIPPGFGGPQTSFHHGPESETTNGGLESLPHNDVHGAVGGAEPGTDPNKWWNLGLMSMPITAGVDPIFWLHHANIDRLWSVWSAMPGHADPADPAWRGGPADRSFVMPLNGGRTWRFTPAEMLDTSAAPLGYRYDDEAPPSAPARIARRLGALGVQALSPAGIPLVQETDVTNAPPPALIGASDGEVAVTGRTGAQLRLDTGGVAALRTGLARAAAAGGTVAREPARVFLKLEGIRATADAAIYRVYVDLPPHGNPDDYADRLAGTVSLFGVSAATTRDGPGAGSGINQVLEITEIVDALHLSGDDLATLDIQFVPANPASAESNMRVRRINVFTLDG